SPAATSRIEGASAGRFKASILPQHSSLLLRSAAHANLTPTAKYLACKSAGGDRDSDPVVKQAMCPDPSRTQMSSPAAAMRFALAKFDGASAPKHLTPPLEVTPHTAASSTATST